eukprot:CAMPEP_0175221790 /NCGR_PEP_ID=MMETSP0093-20121207/20485_1 /TAXON_ID=311494 /ORGANISM="Alexandrium monilatum, Strain CCMP3105" /LENGTH=88 /DNA_ID=CAMNT_0016515347 /DNA_START=45 /DNA_END=306 /DNA_ORIENTATION=-
MYYRLHKATGRQSVKIFRDEHGRHFCEHCEAYELLNTLLGCNAQHGPKRGWAADESQGAPAEESTPAAWIKDGGGGGGDGSRSWGWAG